MGTTDRGNSLWLIPALLTAAGVAGVGVALVLGTSARPADSPKTALSAPPVLVDWFGGASQQNIEALAFLFASENETGSLLLWALQALSANNWARLLAGKHPKVKSIADMLRAGIEKATKRWHYGLDWGPQYDKPRKITRWAATTRGLAKSSVGWRYFEFAQRLLENRIPLDELRGKRGETMVPRAQWSTPVSFLQYEGFGETVQRQAGEGADTDVETVLRRWHTPPLIASVEGVRFYGR